MWPGPVLIDVPSDVPCLIDYEPPYEINLPGYKPAPDTDARQINKAAEAIADARRPLIYAGGGVIISGAHNELLRLAETLAAPVTCTLMGMGGFPGSHPLFLGMLGMHGTKYANFAVSECDLLIAVGARFDNRVTGKLETFASKANNSY